MDGVVRIWGGNYYDYWFTDDAFLRVRLTSRSTVLSAFVIFLALAILFGLLGAIVGIVLSALIYSRIGKSANNRRALFDTMSVQELEQKRLVNLRIPYSTISVAELRGSRLTLTVGDRQTKISFPKASLQELQSVLQSKMGGRFTVSAS
jgi:hypothetical protein